MRSTSKLTDSRISIADLADTPSFIDQWHRQCANEYAQQEDVVIKQAFAQLALPVTEDFIKEHCCKIIKAGDPFEHIWYHFGQPDAIRIISIEKEIRCSWGEEGGNYKMRVERKYY